MSENIDTLGFGKKEFDDVRVCDGCAAKFNSDSYGLVYFTDLVWVEYQELRFPHPIPQELYCFDCYPDEIPIPHSESTEGFSIVEFTSDSDEDKSEYMEVGILNISHKNNGIDWDPIKIMNKYQLLPLEEIEYRITPMQVFSYFRKLGIDLRGFVIDDRLDIPEEKADNLRALIQMKIKRSDTPVVSYDEL